MRTLYLALIVICFTFIANGQTAKIKTNASDEITLNALVNKKVAIDEYLKKNSKALTVLVKVPGKKSLVKVKDDEWPDDIEFTYNILRNIKGRVILVVQIPYSESGDWFISYSHYFDEQGKTFSFDKKTNVFSEEIEGGIAYEADTKYYDDHFNMIKQILTLKDKSGKAITKGQNIDAYSYKYNIYPYLDKCLSGYNIESIK